MILFLFLNSVERGYFGSLFNANSIHIVAHSYGGTSSNSNVLINGVPGNSYSSLSGTSSNTHQKLTIGRPPGYENYYGHFEIGEVIVISSIDSQKIVELKIYRQWSLSAKTDSDGDGFVDSVENKENTDPTN